MARHHGRSRQKDAAGRIKLPRSVSAAVHATDRSGVIGRLVVVEENGLGIADGRQSSRSLAIMRHGDFNALRSFGFLHLDSCVAASFPSLLHTL